MNQKRSPDELLQLTELPTTVPGTGEAWEDMRRRLEDEMPKRPVAWLFRKRWLGLLLLLLLTGTAATWLITARPFETGKSTQASAQYSDTVDDSHNREEKTLSHDKTATSQHTFEPSDRISEAAPANEQLLKTKNLIDAQQSVKPKKVKPKKVYKSKRAGKHEVPSPSTYTATAEPGSSVPGDAVDNAADRSEELTKTDKKKDSLSPEPPAPPVADIAEEKKIGSVLTAGLQWPLQLPSASADFYFDGPDGETQAYRVLLPGVWISLQTQKHILTAELNPFFSNLVPAKPFASLTTSEYLPDTVIVTTTSKSLRKTFGVSAGVSYTYNFTGNWWVGGGMQFYGWDKALGSADAREDRIALSGSGKTTRNYSYNYLLPPNEREHFLQTQASLLAMAMYRHKRWETGLRLYLPLTPLADDAGPKHPMRSELLIRLRVFGKH